VALDTINAPWWCRVEHWLTPNSGHSELGTLCWLASTSFPLSICLGAPEWATKVQLPLASLYAWHECVQFTFIVGNWQEHHITVSGKKAA